MQHTLSFNLLLSFFALALVPNCYSANHRANLTAHEKHLLATRLPNSQSPQAVQKIAALIKTKTREELLTEKAPYNLSQQPASSAIVTAEADGQYFLKIARDPGSRRPISDEHFPLLKRVFRRLVSPVFKNSTRQNITRVEMSDKINRAAEKLFGKNRRVSAVIKYLIPYKQTDIRTSPLDDYHYAVLATRAPAPALDHMPEFRNKSGKLWQAFKANKQDLKQLIAVIKETGFADGHFENMSWTPDTGFTVLDTEDLLATRSEKQEKSSFWRSYKHEKVARGKVAHGLMTLWGAYIDRGIQDWYLFGQFIKAKLISLHLSPFVLTTELFLLTLWATYKSPVAIIKSLRNSEYKKTCAAAGVTTLLSPVIIYFWKEWRRKQELKKINGAASAA